MERANTEEELLPGSTLVFQVDSISDLVPPSQSWATSVVVLSSIVALCGSFATGCAAGHSSPAEAGIMEDPYMSVASYSIFGSVITIGGVIGSIVNGKMADLIGCLVAGSWKTFNGNWIRAVTVYIAEITPKNVRGGFIAANQAKVGREKQLEVALQCLRGKNVNIQHKAAYVRDYTKTFQGHSEARLLDLFKGRYALALIAVAELLLLQQFGGNNAIAFYASSILKKSDFSSNVGLISMAIVRVPATAVSVLLIDRAGRQPHLLVRTPQNLISSLTTNQNRYLARFDAYRYKSFSENLNSRMSKTSTSQMRPLPF
ncbi:hypothetical protein GH714_003416 [Hevea brasiliensis]|uniref:Major facilitator superfamily (MFS) profile domain-containing protein n=1 Tax=Hevea brasiliensis TaxID=3981 RepID=A0A6A6KGP1_HEVBR|nr:hypothetical protein GH714_003416 [Hevea brasiliensis]